MRALCWHGRHDIRCEHVPDPTIEDGRDAIVRVSSCAICGSDLHLFGGFLPGMKSGDILGHEFMGEVVEVGRDNKALRIGDRAKSWRRGIVADLVEDFVPVDLIPGLRRGIAPTVAMVAARALPDGSTELYVMPLSAKTGDPSGSFGAAPLVRAAIAGVRETAEADGAFVSADAPVLGVADPDCPASRAKATTLLGRL